MHRLRNAVQGVGCAKHMIWSTMQGLTRRGRGRRGIRWVGRSCRGGCHLSPICISARHANVDTAATRMFSLAGALLSMIGCCPNRRARYQGLALAGTDWGWRPGMDWDCSLALGPGLDLGTLQAACRAC